MPEEMQLFRNVGFTDAMTMVFGAAQLAAGVGLVHPKSRRSSALFLVPPFVVATYALFAADVMPFAPLSLGFIAMAAWVARTPRLAAQGSARSA